MFLWNPKVWHRRTLWSTFLRVYFCSIHSNKCTAQTMQIICPRVTYNKTVKIWGIQQITLRYPTMQFSRLDSSPLVWQMEIYQLYQYIDNCLKNKIFFRLKNYISHFQKIFKICLEWQTIWSTESVLCIHSIHSMQNESILQTLLYLALHATHFKNQQQISSHSPHINTLLAL